MIKEIELKKISEANTSKLQQQIDIMEIFEHPNIIGVRDCYRTEKDVLCIVMDHADDGDFEVYTNKQRRLGSSMKEEEVISQFIQIVLAIKEAHDMNVIHREIKPDNILLTKKGFLRLSGYESAKCILTLTGITATNMGAQYHTAPEILQEMPYKISSDIWSLGILLYLLCTFKYPFCGRDDGELFRKIMKGSYKPIPDTYSEPLQELISSLLTIDPEKRPTVDQILSTPLLSHKVSEYVKSDLFKEEFLEISKGSKRREEDLEEPEDLYERYLDKIQQVLGLEE